MTLEAAEMQGGTLGRDRRALERIGQRWARGAGPGLALLVGLALGGCKDDEPAPASRR